MGRVQRIVWLSPESTHTGVLLGTIHATHTYMRRLIKPVVAVSESGLFGVRGWGRVCPLDLDFITEADFIVKVKSLLIQVR